MATLNHNGAGWQNLMRKEALLVSGLTLLAALLRFALIGEKSVWLDEAFSIWIARHELGEMWGWLMRIDQHPPLYYTLLHFWVRLFGDLQGPVRTLSALCSTLAVPVFYAAIRRLLDQPTALIAAFILAVSPFHVRFAQETRMYGLLTLGVAAALYFCAVMINAEARRREGAEGAGRASRFHWWGLAISQAAVMLTHNTATVYFPLALNLAVVGMLLNAEEKFNAEAKRRRGAEGDGIRADPPNQPNPRHPRSILPLFDSTAKRPKTEFLSDGSLLGRVMIEAKNSVFAVESLFTSPFLRRWLRFQAVALLLWSPWAWPFVVQTVGVDRQFWILPPSPETVWNTFRTFNFSFLPGDLPLQPVWMALYAGLALWGALRLRRTDAFRLLVSLLIGPLVVALLVSLRRPIFYDRTLIWLTLPYYTLIAAGVRGAGKGIGDWGAGIGDRLGRRALGRSFQLGLLALIFALSALSLTSYYFWFEKEGWDEAAAFVAENVGPDDLIVFNATWVQIPFEYYYRHYGLETELRGLPVDLFDRGVLEPIMAESDVAYLRELVDGQERVWLVYSHDWYTDPDKIIPREMGRSLREVSRARFTGLQVIRYTAR